MSYGAPLVLPFAKLSDQFRINYIIVRLRYYASRTFQIALNLKSRKTKNNTLIEDISLIKLIKVFYSRLNY